MADKPTAKELVAQMRTNAGLMQEVLKQNSTLTSALEAAQRDFDRLKPQFGPGAQMQDYYDGGWKPSPVLQAIDRMKAAIDKALNNG